MAKIIGVDMTDLELLNFFYHFSMADILSSNQPQDYIWLKTTPSKISSHSTIRKACLLVAGMDLAQRRAQAKYLVNNEPYPSEEPVKDKQSITGYVQPTEKFQEFQMKQFTALLQSFHKNMTDLKSGDTTLYGDMILCGVFVYLAALSMGPLVPIITYVSGQGDLLGLSRSIRSIHEIISGASLTNETDTRPYPPVPDEPEKRQLLPQEEDLWNIVDLAETPDQHMALHKALHALIQFYNMDVDGGSISHMTAWPIFWPYSFQDLQRQRNPLALVIICYWCAYVHSFHSFPWWRDRAVEDLYTIIDELPPEYHDLVEWPLSVVQSFDLDEIDYLTGRFHISDL